jgi:uncharacterized glyoxalase superfamily protein PhnB
MPPVAAKTPPGWHTVVPRIVAPDPEGLVRFLQRVFEARGDFSLDAPAEMWVGDSVMLISGPAVRTPMPSFLYVYVEDVDAVHGRALAEGAISLEEPRDLPYGDRRAMVEDPWGNLWQVAARKA